MYNKKVCVNTVVKIGNTYEFREEEGTKMSSSYRKIWLYLAIVLFLFQGTDIYAKENGKTVQSYENFQYQYVEQTDSIEIVGYIGNEEVVHIPSEINGKPVTEIKHLGKSGYAGNWNPDTKEIIIPYGIKKIAGFSSCENVMKVDIPNSVEEIEAYAFYGCKKLENIELPDSINKIGIAGFSKCEKLQTINLPNRVTELGGQAFYGCSSLKQIALPNKLKLIDELAFAGCEKLEKVTIPYGVKRIGVEAFAECNALKEIQIPDSVTKIDEAAFFCCEKLAKVTLPNKLKIVKKDTFNGCILKSIQIPKSVTKIESCAFANNFMTQITIPSKVTYIGDYAFSSCKKLKKVTMKGTKIKKIGKKAFYLVNKKVTFEVPNKCIKKYKTMLKNSKSFKNGKVKIIKK